MKNNLSSRIYAAEIVLKKNLSKQILLVLRSPSVVIFGISVALMALNIIVIGKIRPFNSDDLYWQQVVRTWVPFSGDTLYFGTKDIFVEQAPFFALMEHLFNPGRKLLILETLLLTLSSFALFYASSLYFLKKLKVKLTYLVLLPFVWLASFGYPLVQNYLNSDWRTFEVGLSFATFVLVASVLLGDVKPLRSIWSKLLSILATLLIGIIIYSDPYYIFFTIGPLLLFTGALYLLKKIDRTQAAIIFGGTVLSMIFAKFTALIWEKAGAVIVTDTPSVFVSFDDIVTNIVSSLHGLLIVFGGDFFGRPAFHIATLGAMINATILGIILYLLFGLCRTLQRPNIHRLSLPQLWATAFFGGTIILVFAVYTSTTLVAVNNYRFFIILIYCAITFLVAMLSLSKNAGMKLVTGLILLSATAFNLYTTLLTNNVAEQGDATSNRGNSQNYDIIHAVQAEGATKGYASYWQANVNTYLSAGKATFLPSLCTPEGQTNAFRWLIDGGQFEIPAKKSFYLIDPDFPSPPTCTQEQLTSQFGKPEKIVNISNKSILIYNYDISSKIP